MNIKYGNLEKICNYMFGYKAFIKNKQITLSNWELNPLSQSQIIYGASDVIYGYYAFLQCIINVFNLKLNYSLISPDETEKMIPFGGAIVNNIDLLKLCDGIIDSNETQGKKPMLGEKIKKGTPGSRLMKLVVKRGLTAHCIVCGIDHIYKLRRFRIVPRIQSRD